MRSVTEKLLGINKQMIIYLAIFGVVAFWYHAEKKLSLGFRMLATALVVSTVALMLHSAHRVGIFYDRGFVAEAFKTLIEGENVPDQERYLSMIKSYKEGKTNGGSFLWRETKRIQDTRKNKRIEEAADKNPEASQSPH